MSEPASRPQGPAPQRCPSCGDTTWTTLLVARGYPIARCGRCGLIRTLGAPEPPQARYPPFDQGDALLVRLARAAAATLIRERARFVARVTPPGRLLDFGCGSGAFARLMAGRGYDVVGLEPFSLGEPVHENGLRLVRGSLDDLGEPSQRFDAITLWQVLEHLADPAAQLAALAVRLEPRGVLLVSVPNFASWQRRLFGAAWFHLDPPRHLTHFDSVTLRALLLRMGFEPIAERTFHLEYGPVGWLQSALNLVLPHENVLHEFVKDRGELAHLTARQRALALAASLVAAATLAGPSVLAELAAGLGHAGAVVTIAARRLGS